MKVVRKNFNMSEDINEMLIEYCEENGFTQSQAMNHAIKEFLTNEKLKKIAINPKAIVKQVLKEAEPTYKDKEINTVIKQLFG